MMDLTRLLEIKNVLRENDFNYLEEHLECTAPIAEAIDILQADNIFYGVLLPCLLSLRRKLIRLAETEWVYCKPIVTCLRDSLTSRFEGYFNFTTPESQNAVLAALTHPEFKNIWFPCISEDQQEKLEKLLKLAVVDEMKANDKFAATIHNQPSTSSHRHSFFEFGNTRTPGLAEYASKASLQVLHFFGEEDTQFAILKKYTNIHKVFIKYNTPLPSSAPVERLFSYATMSNFPKSNRLSDEMFESE